MTIDEFAEVMAYLAAAIAKPISNASMDVYFDLLGDLPIDVLRVSAKRVALQHKWATFPSVAELREAAAETIAGEVKEMSPAEAWAIAWDSACRIDPEVPGSMERGMVNVPALIVEAMRTFGVGSLCYSKDPMGVIRGQFIKIYEQLQAREHRQRLLPSSVKKSIENIGQRVITERIAGQIGVESS